MMGRMLWISFCSNYCKLTPAEITWVGEHSRGPTFWWEKTGVMVSVGPHDVGYNMETRWVNQERLEENGMRPASCRE